MNYSKGNNKKKIENLQSKAPKVKNRTGFIILRIIGAAFAVCLFAIGGIAAGAYIGIINKSPDISYVMSAPTDDSLSSVIYDTNGNEIDRLNGGENREYVSLSDIPDYLQKAFIAIEDERFYQHNGVDMKAIVRSLYVALTSDSTQGGSTITQQLIKNKLGITRNSIVTKLQEQYLAIEYEKKMTEAYGSKLNAKNKILELYLNDVPLGYNQVGVQAGSLRYFGKDVSQLTLAESAVLAAITQNPTFRDPIRNPENNRARQTDILDKMLSLGFINEDEYNEAMAEDVYSKINETQQLIDEEPSYHSYFVDQVINDVKEDLGLQLGLSNPEAWDLIYNGGIQIYTTEDSSMQGIVDAAFLDDSIFPPEFKIEVQYTISVKSSVTGLTTTYPMEKKLVNNDDEAEAFINSVRDKRLGADDEIADEQIFKIPEPQAGMCIIDYHTGEVKAIAGGRGEKPTNMAFDRATQAERQPGSVFKVLASYAPALDMGKITAATVIDDVPTTIGDYTPSNWYTNPDYRGLSTVREGIRDSMNILAVKNMYNTGVGNCYNYLLNFGFTTLTPDDGKYVTTALGGIEYGVTQLETAAAYGTIANGGIYIKPHFYTKVLDANGKVLLDNNPEPKRVLSETTAYILTNMMEDVITSGTGTTAKFQNISMPIAGKTGTTSENKDLFFCGYTPYYVASIYLGYDTPMPVATETQTYHEKIWRYIMEQIHANLEPKDFEVPDGIVTVDVCEDSGMLPTDACRNDPRGSRVHSEIFAAGTQPTEYCTVHKTVTVDTSTGYVANAYCPPEFVKTITGIIRPIPYNGDAYIPDKQYELSATLAEGTVCPVHTAPVSTPAPSPTAAAPDLGWPFSVFPPGAAEQTEPPGAAASGAPAATARSTVVLPPPD